MERPYTIDHLNHVVLRVRDLPRSLAFYTMIGGDVQGEVAAGTLVRIPSGQSIILQERADYVPAAVGSVDHINLMIRAADIHEVARYLRANGAELVGEPELSRAGPTVNVRDPDGYVLEIRILREG
ncbi:MAG: glyoxylase family protein [Chloroflexota bacterium]|jgi:catechol 2,3-dioxygenase-like lactoylglutathione lyase family enzyme|nr:glyoxylase family protein [Chloroflexota bacterium]